jgi:uncharacterized membrane-anchored protein
MRLSLTRILALVFGFLTAAAASLAQSNDAQKPSPQAAWEAAVAAAARGPSEVGLGEQATLHLPDGYMFLPKKEATMLMEAFGNSVGPGFHGVVAPTANNQNWLVTVDHTAEGYVKDDDAKNWDKDALLQSLKDGTAEQNKKREEMGIEPLDIAGWIQEPTYDAATHRLIWSLRARERGAASGDAATVNYNTYALGRDGFFELDLLTNDRDVERDKTSARELLAALDYKPGKRYEDFNASTDHIAEYGLAALIGGIAAKKLGLLAVIGVFIAKFAKIILIAVAAFGAGALKFFRRNKAES